MTVMREQVYRPGGGPAADAWATVRLVASTSDRCAPAYSNGDLTILGHWTNHAGADGIVSFDLDPTSTVAFPTGTVYSIETYTPECLRPEARYFTVPDVAGPLWIKDYLTDPPAALASSALGSHEAALDPHPVYATDADVTAAVAGTGTGIETHRSTAVHVLPQPPAVHVHDAAAPLAHALSHASGSDLLTPAAIGAETPTGAQAKVDTTAATLQLLSEKGQPSGYAELDTAGKVPASRMPALAITDVFPVTSQAAMLALVAERGDVAIRSDINATFILAAEPATTLANWLQLPIPADAVLSVQGQTGVVTLPSDGPVGTASLRTLGVGAQQALPGNHASTTDQRTPLDGSVTYDKLAFGARRPFTRSNVYHRPAILATAAFGFSASDFRLWLVTLPTGSIRSVAFDVATGGDAASRVRPLLYRPDGVGNKPGSLLVDGGQVDTSTAGIKSPVVPTTVWGGGPVWVGVHVDAGTAPSLRYVTSSPEPQLVGSGGISTVNIAEIGYRATTGLFPQGAPPATFPEGSIVSNPPIVGVECY